MSSSQLKLLALEDKTFLNITVFSKNKEKNLKTDRTEQNKTLCSVPACQSLNSKADNKTDNKAETIPCRRNLPEAIIFGIPKCGTAALNRFLSFHPNISTNPSVELNFFSVNYEKGLDWYRNQLPCASSNQLTIERSTEYFHKLFIPERVWQWNKKIKLLLSVCEPVRRTISHFAMLQSTGSISSNITAERYFLKPKTLKGVFGLRFQQSGNVQIGVMRISDYASHFSAWLRYFPLTQIHLIDGDNLSRDPYTEVSAVEQFLGVGHYIKRENFVFNSTKGFFCYNNKLTKADRAVNVNEHSDNKDMVCLAPGKGRKHPDIDEKVISWMKSVFKPSNQQFFKIVNRNFKW